MAEICCIPDCDEEVRYKHLGVCAACYAGLALWRGRPAKLKRKRMQQYVRLQSRMQVMIDEPKFHPVRRDDLDRSRKKKANGK